jgi:hypothetical protein
VNPHSDDSSSESHRESLRQSQLNGTDASHGDDVAARAASILPPSQVRATAEVPHEEPLAPYIDGASMVSRQKVAKPAVPPTLWSDRNTVPPWRVTARVLPHPPFTPCRMQGVVGRDVARHAVAAIGSNHTNAPPAHRGSLPASCDQEMHPPLGVSTSGNPQAVPRAFHSSRKPRSMRRSTTQPSRTIARPHSTSSALQTRSDEGTVSLDGAHMMGTARCVPVANQGLLMQPRLDSRSRECARPYTQAGAIRTLSGRWTVFSDGPASVGDVCNVPEAGIGPLSQPSPGQWSRACARPYASPSVCTARSTVSTV